MITPVDDSSSGTVAAGECGWGKPLTPGENRVVSLLLVGFSIVPIAALVIAVWPH